MTLTHRLDGETGIFEIELDGDVDPDAYRAVVRDLEAEMKAQGRLRVLEVVHRLGWINPVLWLQDLRWTLTHMRAFSRVALVSDRGWIRLAACGAAVVLPIRFRTFTLAEREKARAWLLEA